MYDDAFEELEQASLSAITEPINLGYVNGWKQTPGIVSSCKHKKEFRKVRRGIEQIKCNICKFYYFIDSTD